MADVAIIRTAVVEGIVRLWQAPDVMIADGLGISVSDRHLVVEDFVVVVPHALQPIEAKLYLVRPMLAVLGYAARAHLVGKITNADQHEVDGVAVGLNKLHVIARVPPA